MISGGTKLYFSLRWSTFLVLSKIDAWKQPLAVTAAEPDKFYFGQPVQSYRTPSLWDLDPSWKYLIWMACRTCTSMMVRVLILIFQSLHLHLLFRTPDIRMRQIDMKHSSIYLHMMCGNLICSLYQSRSFEWQGAEFLAGPWCGNSNYIVTCRKRWNYNPNIVIINR